MLISLKTENIKYLLTQQRISEYYLQYINDFDPNKTMMFLWIMTVMKFTIADCVNYTDGQKMLNLYLESLPGTTFL